MNTITDAQHKQNALLENDWAYVSIVRDPVERFLSAFMYSCLSGARPNERECQRVCHGCGPNMTCFLERQYEKIREIAKDPPKNSEQMDAATLHAYPQSW
jgi:hypothetical protein